MTRTSAATATAPVPATLGRRFEAIVFDWDGTAVPEGHSDASRVRRLVEEACALGLDLAVVSGTHVANVDGQLGARPGGPGALWLLLNRGSEAYCVDRDGPRLVHRRTTATAQEDCALSRAAQLTLGHLAARGLQATIVPGRLNRRKIDLIPEPEWADPPRARIAELLVAVERRLAAAGIGSLADSVAIARVAAAEAGLRDARVTSDVKHVEIGLTDKSDSARWIVRELWWRGIAPRQVLVVGDELGPLGGLPGSDSNLLVDETRGVTTVSVGIEPGDVPVGVVALGGGPDAFATLLEDQIERRRRGELPIVDADRAWVLVIEGVDPLLERAHESLLTLADGRLGTRGSVLSAYPGGDPGVLVSGIYDREGADSQLLPAPRWSAIATDLDAAAPVRRVLDLHAGVLRQDLGPPEALLFSSARASGHGRCARARSQPAPTLDARAARPGGRHSAGGRGRRVLLDARHEFPRLDRRRCERRHARRDRVTGARPHRRLRGQAGRAPPTSAARSERCDKPVGSGSRRCSASTAAHGRPAGRTPTCASTATPSLQLAVRFALFHLMATVGRAGRGGRRRARAERRRLPRPRVLGQRRLRAPVPCGDATRGGARDARVPRAAPAGGAARGPRTSVARARAFHGSRRPPARTSRHRRRAAAGASWSPILTGAARGAHRRRRRLGGGLLRRLDRRRGVRAPGRGSSCWSRPRAGGRRGSSSTRDGDAATSATSSVPTSTTTHVDDNAYTNVMARWNLRRAASAACGRGGRRRAPAAGWSSPTPSSTATTPPPASTSSSPGSTSSSRS